MEVGCPRIWGWSCRTETQVARAPPKPAPPATQPREMGGEGGGDEGLVPVAPYPSKRKPVNATLAML